MAATPANMTSRIFDAGSVAQREDAAQQAARALESGRIVGLPTETVYGLAALATGPELIERLRAARSEAGEAGEPRGLLTWHVHSPATILDVAPVRSAAQRVLVERLAPGPVTFSFALDEAHCASMCAQSGAARGIFEDGSQALLRCPAPLVTRRALELLAAPVVMVSVQSGGGSAGSAAQAAEALARVDDLSRSNEGPILLVDDGVVTQGRQSTLLRFEADGSYRVVREGLVEERFIHKQLDVTIVFVCTGNTCRSPMAAAIAKDLLFKMDTGGLRVHVRSAGVGAGGGSPATPEGVQALERMGVPPGRHTSSGLSRELLAQADFIYGMTQSHVDAIGALDRAAGERSALLDPQGSDIPDPIGQTQDVYDDTARLIRDAVSARLTALVAGGPGSDPARRDSQPR